jgi:cell division protein FtsN
MARNQYQKNNKNQGSGQLLMILVAFATGYMSSTIIDINHLGVFFNESISKLGLTKQHARPIQEAPQKIARQPQLEFYTVLARKSEHRVPVGTDLQKMLKPNELTKQNAELAENKSVEAKKVVPVEVAKAIDAVPTEDSGAKKGQYVVQLASFRYYSQAEKFRAKLLLKGFDVKITSISRGTLQWYRVMLGPFANQAEARKAQLAYQTREHTSGMVRPVDA